MITKNTRDLLLTSALTRVVTDAVSISATGARFIVQKNSAGVSPSSITLTATVTGGYSTAASITWQYALNTSPNTWVTLGSGTIAALGYTRVITNTNISSIIDFSTANTVYFKCTVSQSNKATVSAQYFIDYYIEPQDGATTYTWTAYADDALGTNISTSPTGKPFIGFATNKSTATDPLPLTYTDYAWNRIEGDKSTTLMLFRWANTTQTVPNATITYNWDTKVVTNTPPGWSTSALPSLGSGYTLYTITAPVRTFFSDLSAVEYNLVTIGSSIGVFGYTEKGDIGLTGASSRRAYTVTTSSTPPTGITAGTGDVVPTAPGTWTSVATSVLAGGEFLYQVDGTLNPEGTLVTWGNAYLSNLKVGSLSAISANLGVVDIATAGNLKSGKTSFADDTNSGFYLGNDLGTTKLKVGTSTNYLKWDGSNLDIKGDIIADTASLKGVTIYAADGTTVLLDSGSTISSKVVYNDIPGTKPPINADNTASNISAGISGQGALATANNVYVGYTVKFPNGTTMGTGDFVNSLYNPITSTNISTFIGAAAISDAYIGSLSAAKITAGTLSSGVIYAGTINASQITAGHIDVSSIQIVSSVINNAGITTGANFYAWNGGSYGSYGTSGQLAILNSGQVTTYSTSAAPAPYGASFTNGGAHGYVGYSGYDFYAAGATASNFAPFTGSHDAVIPISTLVEIGDILVDNTCIIRKNVSNTLFETIPTSMINNPKVVGVVANIHGVLSLVSPPTTLASTITNSDTGLLEVSEYTDEYYTYKDTHNLISINALGEGQVNVCGENGNISAGDYITTSSIPGKGMKQSDDLVHNYTVAKAREGVTFSSPTEVKMVACIYVCG